jgi:hypothetical protein
MKLKVFLPLALSLSGLLLSPSCKKEIPNMDAYVYGKVYNQNSSDPVSGALVRLKGYRLNASNVNVPILDSAYSNEKGEYDLSYQTDEAMSGYALEVLSPKHIESNTLSLSGDSIFIHPGKLEEIDLYLIPISWLRVRCLRFSIATYLLIHPIPLAGGNGIVVTQADTTHCIPTRGNEYIFIDCQQGFPSHSFPLQMGVQTATHDTVDVLIEW